MDPRKRKSLIHKISEFVVFFNTCDNNLEIIIKKIEDTKKRTDLDATLNFLKALKFIFGSAFPADVAAHGTFASTRDTSSIQNNFLSKLLFFFGSIKTISNPQIMFHLSSITNDFSINVKNFCIMVSFCKEGIKKNMIKMINLKIAKKIATLELNIKQNKICVIF